MKKKRAHKKIKSGKGGTKSIKNKREGVKGYIEAKESEVKEKEKCWDIQR